MFPVEGEIKDRRENEKKKKEWQVLEIKEEAKDDEIKPKLEGRQLTNVPHQNCEYLAAEKAWFWKKSEIKIRKHLWSILQVIFAGKLMTHIIREVSNK